ncbi:MAG: hypothetical protein ACIARR_07515 [Phycisphaerales bacterium JB059]
MSQQTDTRISGAALCLSALVLGALIIAQGAGLFDSRASADMAISSAGVTMMTTRSGNTEPLFVVDDRTETLFVYKHERGRLELWSKHSLPDLFARARSGAAGVP